MKQPTAGSQHAPGQGSGLQVPPGKNCPLVGQLAAVVIKHPPAAVAQHAPGHGSGVHEVAVVMIVPLHGVPNWISEQIPFASQQT